MTDIIAHRGDSAHAPENTLRAFELAIAKGADRIELDLQRSADGEVFVFHDLELDRLTGESGPAHERSIDELREIAVLPTRHAPGPDACIPTLDEVLNAIGDRTQLYLEVKTEAAHQYGAPIEPLVDACLDRVDPHGPHQIASFHLGVVRRALGAGYPAVLIANDPRQLDELAHHHQEALYALSVRHDRIDAYTVNRCRELRLPLWAWTVDDEESLERLLALGGVDAVCTNDVARMRALLERSGERA